MGGINGVQSVARSQQRLQTQQFSVLVGRAEGPAWTYACAFVRSCLEELVCVVGFDGLLGSGCSLCVLHLLKRRREHLGQNWHAEWLEHSGLILRSERGCQFSQTLQLYSEVFAISSFSTPQVTMGDCVRVLDMILNYSHIYPLSPSCSSHLTSCSVLSASRHAQLIWGKICRVIYFKWRQRRSRDKPCCSYIRTWRHSLTLFHILLSSV